MFNYFNRKSVKKSRDEVEKLKRKTDLIYNLIDIIQYNKELFNNPIQTKNSKINEVLQKNKWIYPIVVDSKKFI